MKNYLDAHPFIHSLAHGLVVLAIMGGMFVISSQPAIANITVGSIIYWAVQMLEKLAI